MTSTFIILGVLLAAYVALKWFASAKPSTILSSGRTALLVLGIMAVVGLAATGRMGWAIPLGMMLVSIYGRGFFTSGGGKARAKARKARTSMVRSAALEMVLHHDTGRMEGRVLAGSYEGRDLDQLDVLDLIRLNREIASDAESLSLLEAYLDRRLPRWREDFDLHEASRHGRAPHPGAMSEEEAYQILGLAKGAAESDIRAAHRRLMKQVHPDHGGSTFLAARINEAKDRLLSRHR